MFCASSSTTSLSSCHPHICLLLQPSFPGTSFHSQEPVPLPPPPPTGPGPYSTWQEPPQHELQPASPSPCTLFSLGVQVIVKDHRVQRAVSSWLCEGGTGVIRLVVTQHLSCLPIESTSSGLRVAPQAPGDPNCWPASTNHVFPEGTGQKWLPPGTAVLWEQGGSPSHWLPSPSQNTGP